jgi:FdhD protein
VEVARVLRSAGVAADGRREAPEETPIAIVHDAATTAVMMATPADFEDFAYGFSFTEGLIGEPADVTAFEAEASDLGVELRVWLASDRSAALASRRRAVAGPTGCGLCGIESLAEAARAARVVGEGLRVNDAQVHAALAALPAAQALGQRTRAVHAAGWWTPDRGLVAVREDVGRHNALDKLIGALWLAGEDADAGLVVLTSRVSVELVQKAAAFGAQMLVAVSAPTALAVRTAGAAGMTLVAVARDDAFEVFSRPDRIGP